MVVVRDNGEMVQYGLRLLKKERWRTGVFWERGYNPMNEGSLAMFRFP